MNKLPRRLCPTHLWLSFVIAGFASLAAAPAMAREKSPPPSVLHNVQDLAVVHRLILPPTDPQAELIADASRPQPGPQRFAVPQKVHITPATDGTWEQLADGRLWRFRAFSQGATDLNFGFTSFWLPEGATLHIVAESENYFQGPYTAQDNKAHGQFWSPVVPGDSAVLELFVPSTAQGEPELVLGQISAGYRDWFHRKSLSSPKAEGACEIDVVCPQGAPWTNEIRSVGLYSLNGSLTCSGTLINDAAGDFHNFFLTANHCSIDSGNAATIVVYWNFQSATCGTHGPGSMAQNQSGAIFRAAKTDVDFALIELDDIPDPSFNVYYSGWDRSGTAPPGCVGIHHPDADVKAISFSTKPLTTVTSCIGSGGVNTHWQVTWSAGVTEPGSSGSGIWDPNSHKLIGTLSGGSSACSSPTAPDCYGKFSVSWGSGTSSADRLRDWLDPLNTGVVSVTGTNPVPVPALRLASAALAAESCTPTNGVIDSGEMVTVNFTLRNAGTLDVSNVVATLQSASGVIFPSAPQSYGTLAAGGASVTHPFSFVASGVCGSTITPTLQLQSGTNNLGILSAPFVLGVQTQVFSQTFDGVISPALPAGWSNQPAAIWTTTTNQHDTAPNSVFTADPDVPSDRRLTSPSIAITTTNAQVNFRHWYNTEDGFDGGVLEISINGAAFTDILTAGGSFLARGYNATIPPDYQNPLTNRAAWSGDSGGFITSTALLPPSAAGKNVQLRWRLGSDNSTSGVGWYVDTITIGDGYICCNGLVQPRIVNVRVAPPAGIAFSYDAVPGQKYVIQTSTNLGATNWAAAQTNTGDGTRQSFTNSGAGAARKFFRLRTQ